MSDLRKAAEMALEALSEYTCVVQSGTDPTKWNEVIDGGGPAREAIQALRQALARDALDELAEIDKELGLFIDTTGEVTGEVLAQPEQRGHCTCGDPTLLGYVHFRTRPCIYYTAPPKREWVGLTGEEARKFYEKYTGGEELIYAIDRFLEEKNT